MLKLVNHTLRIFLLVLISSTCFSQTEKFDILTYTAPVNWKKDLKQGVVNYTDANASTGRFCVIAMYASTTSSGSPQTDFNKDWKELVVKPFNAESHPKISSESTPDGWTVVTASAPVTQDGVDLYIMLTVISGFGKTVSVRTSLNDQSYLAQLASLFESMDLDKTVNVQDNNSAVVTNNNNTTGATGKFGTISYSSPSGWSEEHFRDGVVFKPLDLPAGEHLAIQIMMPLVAYGTLEQALEQSFAEATTMYSATSMYQAGGKYSKNAPQRSFKGWEYIRSKGAIKDINGSELGLELFIVKINNRFERVAILESRKYCGGTSLYYATDKVRYRNNIEDLLYSLQFSDFNGTSSRNGSAKGNGVVGVWQGTIQGTGAATGVSLDVFNPIFFNNGQVYFGPKFPTEGLDGLNSWILPELYPRNWGTYTLSNGSGILKMPFANIPFRIQGDKLIVHKNQMDWSFYKLNPVDGARFNGTYHMAVSYEMLPVITFMADGRFSDNGVIRVLGHLNNTCANEGYVPGSGTYEVRNYSILFNYADGRRIKLAFLGTQYDKSQISPATIRMGYNEDPMVRQ